MAQNGVPIEYRILMRRVLETSSDLSSPQFTVTVAAARPDDAISEAERLTDSRGDSAWWRFFPITPM